MHGSKRRRGQLWVAFTAAVIGALALVTAAGAQTMYLDFAQVRLGGTWDDCMARARRALAAERWNVGGEYGAPQRGGYFVAWNGPHGVILVCDIEPAGGTLVHLTMSGQDEGNRPLVDALVQQLRGEGGGGGGGNLGQGRYLTVTLTNGEVVVNYRDLPGSAGNWVSVIRAGAADDQYTNWAYTSGATGTFSAGRLPAGEYEARLYLNWPAGGYNVVDRVRFRVP